ncbi:hypothetical protein P5673_032536 [Acropora cervicornis]|uniref:Uncharacterized protein n=1 Tax=Acropora cervicornis TaxID=6130 RepID=A0AAD9PQZ7_ACRCE|nr:hypothetical protein P5673_032536 [Acropora cervicornis]
MDMDTTRGTGASQGNVVCFKRFNEAWLEQLFILLKIQYMYTYFTTHLVFKGVTVITASLCWADSFTYSSLGFLIKN